MPAKPSACGARKTRTTTATSPNRTWCPCGSATNGWPDRGGDAGAARAESARASSREYGLREYDAEVLTATRAASEYFETAAQVAGDPKTAANWVMGDLLGLLKAEGKEIADSPVTAANLGELVKLIAAGEISGKLAKEIFPKMFATGEPASAIIEREGLKQISDTAELDRIIDEVIAKNPKQVEQFKGGKTTVINFLVGQVMRSTRGQANVTVVTEIFQKKVGRGRDMLKEGDQAPEIQVHTDTGEAFRLSDLKGKRVVLYFYPKADTPGCTTEVLRISRRHRAFAGKGVTVIGISPDKPAAQSKFKSKYDLPFTLLGRRGEGCRPGVRRLEREEHVRQEGDGDRAHHLRHRPGRQNREDLREGEGAGARCGGPGGPVKHSWPRTFGPNPEKLLP